MSSTIIGTCEDALTAKASCANLGYYKDPFISALSPRGAKKSPLINRGYWARIKIVESVVDEFLKLHKGQNVQILSLGAGMDTLFFRMHDAGMTANVRKFVEIDFPEVISRKIVAMRSKPAFQNVTKGWKFSLKECKGDRYEAFGQDLSHLEDVERSLKVCGINFAAPTLIISECVMCYMEVKASDQLIKWSTHAFSGNLAMFVYEQILPGTRFGKMMVKNIHARGLPTASLFAYPSLEAQEKRYTNIGFHQASARDLKTLYNEYIDQKECSRVARIELFDEFEEWNMLMGHYCCTLALRNAASDLGQPPVVEKVAWCDPKRPKATGFVPPRNILLRNNSTDVVEKTPMEDVKE